MTKKDKPYYEPAGIFSTDNWQSDQMQIMAEEYDEDEWGPQDDFDELDDEYYNQPTIYRTFECSVYGPHKWHAWEECFESDSLELMIPRYQAEHDKDCDCGQPIKAE